MEWRNHIVSNPTIHNGKPVIKGTKVTVEQLLEFLSQDNTLAELLENYPHVRPNDLLAVFAYLQECVKDGEVKKG